MGPMESNRYIVIHPRGKRQPLFWVQAGLVQTTVLQHLDREQPVYCLNRLKPDPNQRPLTFDEIAAYHIDTLRSLCPQGPYALAGYCICGTIIFGMASQLRAQGETVSALIMIDPVDPAISRAELIREPPLFRLRFHFIRVLFHLQRIKQYSAREKLAYCMGSVRGIMARLRFRRLANVRSDTAAPDKLGEVHASDMWAFSNYAPRPYEGSAVVLRPAVSPPHAYKYPNRRWAQLISGGLEIQEVPGDSNSMWVMPDAKGMSQRIDSWMARIPRIPRGTPQTGDALLPRPGRAQELERHDSSDRVMPVQDLL